MKTNYFCTHCGTHEVSIDRMCHNSACTGYATPESIYEGWKTPPSVDWEAEYKRFAEMPALPPGTNALKVAFAAGMDWAKREECSWRATVDDMLTTCHMVASDDPRESIDRLINWCVQVSLDPAVSSDARALMERGAEEERDAAIAHIRLITNERAV